MTFKEHNDAPAVSFDFDNSIFMHDWNKEEGDYKRDENGDMIGVLNKDIAKKIVDYKTKGYKVYVITTRLEKLREETEKYLRDNNLMGYIDAVVFTNGSWKAKTCKRYGVERHYDDYNEELKRLRYKGIEGVLVRNEKLPPYKEE